MHYSITSLSTLQIISKLYYTGSHSTLHNYWKQVSQKFHSTEENKKPEEPTNNELVPTINYFLNDSEVFTWQDIHKDDILKYVYKNYHNNSFIVQCYKKNLFSVSLFLKLHSLFMLNNAVDIAVVDNPKYKSRFSVNYLLQSSTINFKCILTVKISTKDDLISLTRVYPAFAWSERELFDMFGIFVTENNDLRRLLTDYGFSDHPLKKDFPLSGFSEVLYSDILKSLNYLQNELLQNLRLN